MRLIPRSGRLAAALVLAAVIGGGLLDGNRRAPLPPAAGQELKGQAPGLAADDRTLTVVQFNIHRGAPAEGPEDLAATALCLEGAELAGLNEVGGAAQAAELGRRLSLAHLYLPSEERWWHPHFGNGLLSALPAAGWQRWPLPGPGGPGYRTRGVVRLPWQGAMVTVLVTHLTRGPDRRLQLDLLAAHFAALPAPKILLGDLNSGPDDPVLAAWRADPDLVVTSGEGSGGVPGGVDWIVAEGFRLVDSWRCDRGASDHPAVGAVLELAP